MAQDLHDWLADPERQRLTQRAIDRFGAEWDRGGVHARFDSAMAGLPEPSEWAVAEAVRGLFGDDDWVDALVGGLAEGLRRDPFFDPPFRHINSDLHSGLIAFEDERVTIAAGVTPVAQLAARKSSARSATSVGFTGRVTVLKFIKAGGARLSFWSAPPITAAFSAADAGRCTRDRELHIADGDIVTIDGRRQSYVVDYARSNLVILQAEIIVGEAPVSVEYDSASGAYLGCSATRDSASRIQMIATLLRKLDCAGAFGPIAAFLEHPDFFVRWHVMKELLGIDAEAAMPHLKRMAARDPHPETRRAARSVLDRIEAPPAQRKAA